MNVARLRRDREEFMKLSGPDQARVLLNFQSLLDRAASQLTQGPDGRVESVKLLLVRAVGYAQDALGKGATNPGTVIQDIYSLGVSGGIEDVVAPLFESALAMVRLSNAA